MRVTYTIHHELNRDAGAAGITVALAEAMQRRGHMTEVLSHDDLPAHWGRRRKTFAFPNFVARATASAEVIDASSGDASRLVATIRRPAVVTRSHGLEHAWDVRREDGEPRRGLATTIMRAAIHLPRVTRSLRGADVAVFSNEQDRRFAIDRLGVLASRTEVMPNGVPSGFGTSAPMADPPSDGLRVAMIGTHIPRKGIRYGVPALNEWLRTSDDRSATLLGTGLSANEVAADFEVDVRGRIAIVPRYQRDALPEILSRHHIVLFPSLFEGFSVGLVEAMACGLAPIAADVRGARDLISDGRSGLLVSPRSSSALVEALEHLDRDRTLLQRMRAQAQEAVRELTWDRIAERTEYLYVRAIEIRGEQR